MTDPMELVGRLEWTAADDYPKHIVNPLLSEAAACIREMVEKIAMLEDEISTYFYPKED